MGNQLPLNFSFYVEELHKSSWSTNEYSGADFESWGYFFFFITNYKDHFDSTIVKINFAYGFSGDGKVNFGLLLEEMMDDLFIVEIGQWKLVHLHDIEPGVWKDEFVASAVDFVDVLRDFNDLDAFHEIEFPNSDFAWVIAWQYEVGVLNLRYTANNRRVSFQLLLQVDWVSLVLQFEHLQLVVVACRDNQLTGNVVMKGMTSWTAHFVSNNRLSVLVYDKWFLIVLSGITDTNASQVVYLAYVIHHYCLLTLNFATHWLLLNVPKVYRVLVGSYPLLEQIQVKYLLPVVFWYRFLSVEVVRYLPKGNPDPVDNRPNSLMKLVKVHWQYRYFSCHVFVSLGSYLCW